MLMLLLACLSFQDAAALIRSLASDEIEAREAAEAELFKLGAQGLEPMKKALALADGEQRARLQGVIARVEREERRKSFKGGEVVCGLASTLRSEKDEYRAGDAITLKLEIMNVSMDVKPYVPARYFDRDLPEGNAHSSGSYGKTIVKQTAGERPTECRSVIG